MSPIIAYSSEKRITRSLEKNILNGKSDKTSSMSIEIPTKLNNNGNGIRKKEMKKKKVVPGAKVVISGRTQSELLSDVKVTDATSSSKVTADVVNVTSLSEAHSPTTPATASSISFPSKTSHIDLIRDTSQSIAIDSSSSSPDHQLSSSSSIDTTLSTLLSTFTNGSQLNQNLFANQPSSPSQRSLSSISHHLRSVGTPSTASLSSTSPVTSDMISDMHNVFNLHDNETSDDEEEHDGYKKKAKDDDKHSKVLSPDLHLN